MWLVTAQGFFSAVADSVHERVRFEGDDPTPYR